MTAKASNGLGDRLQAFIREYQGRQLIGDTAMNRGQCVGLVAVWWDALRLPHIWGNAKDLLENADPGFYKRIVNTPTNFPIAGDIVVWGDIWGAGFGHTGICLTAQVMDLVCFEQNDPEYSTPHIKVYSYSGIIGWLRPLVGS
jgi:hypothetical protein